MNGSFDARRTFTKGCYQSDLQIDITCRIRLKVEVKYTAIWKYNVAYKSWTERWVFIKLTYMININHTLIFTHGQGQKVKGQGQICYYQKQYVLPLNYERMVGHLTLFRKKYIRDAPARNESHCTFVGSKLDNAFVCWENSRQKKDFCK